jgi:hypothetical protein
MEIHLEFFKQKFVMQKVWKALSSGAHSKKQAKPEKLQGKDIQAQREMDPGSS